MRTVIDFIKNNKAASAAYVAVPALILVALAMSGCSLGDVITHRVPPNLQSFSDGESSVSLNESQRVMGYILADVEAYVEANEKAHLIFDVLNSALTVGIEEVGSSPFPGAAFLMAPIFGFAGLMTRKPGTAREIAEEKMASFNKGQEAALEQLKSAVTPDAFRAFLEQWRNGANPNAG